MEEHYTINEILSAARDLRNSKKENKFDRIEIKRSQQIKDTDIPTNTLKLIEEAEKNT
tara:strand:- start:2890 stop:3063 length:174 start_codon:yes stop_codon:yes gene_type:complete